MEPVHFIRNRVVSDNMRHAITWEEPSATTQIIIGLIMGVLMMTFCVTVITPRMSSVVAVGIWWAGAIFSGPLLMLILVGLLNSRKKRARRLMLNQLCAILEVEPLFSLIEQKIEVALAYFAHILTDLGDSTPIFMRAQFAEARDLAHLLYPKMETDKAALIKKWALEGLLISEIGHCTTLRWMAKREADMSKRSAA